MLDTGASCSIINYRTFWEISQFHHSIGVHRSNKLTKTYSGQVVPIISYATMEFSYNPSREAVATGLVFVNIICTQPEPTLPILIENNKNHQITLPKGRIGFSSLDVADKEERKNQIRNPHELTNAIIQADDKYNDCFLLHSTIPAQSPDDCLQIIHGTEDSILQQPHSIGHCISADAKMSKGFADLLSQRISGLRDTCRQTKLLSGQMFPFWDRVGNRYIYNLVTKTKFSEKPNLTTYL